ncbi:MAG: Calx-beta domain-containing protein [Chloroflexota bacterium]
MYKRLNRARFPVLFSVIVLAALVVALMMASLRPPVAEALPAQQTVPVVGFANSVYTVDEDRGPAEISVSVNATPEAGEDIVVTYLTIPGTAQEGTGGDYLHATGTLTFTSATNNVQTFDITILNDSIVNEPDKTVNLLLRLETPETATLGRGEATLIITDDDFATSTPQSSSATTTPIFVDLLEPNNTFAESRQILPNASATCQLTLWPPGDQDFFNFPVKNGTYYRVLTDDLSPGLDTVLTLYDPAGNQVAENDDIGGVGNLNSQVIYRARQDGVYFARVVNKSAADPANLTYCFEIEAMDQPTPTPTATLLPTRTGSDACEPNGQLELACLFGENQSQEFNFVPPFNEGPDQDYYQLWMRAGTTYTCETSNLSNVTDTNMIFLDSNGGDFNPQLGNDNKAPGDLGSRLSIYATYTGYLTILVGPVNPVPLSQADRFTYTLSCVASAAPTATPTLAPSTGGGTGGNTGGGVVVPVAPTVTPFPTPTEFDLSAILTPQPTVIPVVTVQPLPTATPAQGTQDTSTVNVTVYYDANFNFTPEPTEGIVDVAVALYDNTNGRLIAFGYTDELGMVRFDSITSSGAIRVEVPLLNYTQIVGPGESTIQLRVAPLPLPIGIP